MPFDPVDLTLPNSKSKRVLPDEIWTPILEHGCAFPPHIFIEVMLNLFKNPNNNSTHLFRADILYDSQGKLSPPNPEAVQTPSTSTTQEHGTLNVDLPNFELQRTIIGNLIPRNAQLDKPLLQTCHFLHSTASNTDGNSDEKTLVLYLPHASSPTEIPHYHPTVHGIAFLHTWTPASSSADPPPGTLTLHYALYPTTPPPPPPLPPRLHRTAHHLLSTLHKHGTGSLAGYTKRVHHDQLIPQPRLQNTYAALKARHARRLIARWAEQTPPAKHVFEDLGIAAFLIELWADLYGGGARDAASGFPGFVDIGCGNGVLVDVLSREGYKGWGFDARRRKTWDTFEPGVRRRLRRCVLVPKVVVDLETERVGAVGVGVEFDYDYDDDESDAQDSDNNPLSRSLRFHNGLFRPGTFIVSNHADELTPWTPLLAALSRSPFLAIPCCSHDLSGARSRAYVPSPPNNGPRPCPEKGDLRTLRASAKQPSAYASLVAWVERLAAEVGFVVQREVLRIPSTRNVGVVGRFVGGGEGDEAREERVREIVRREGGGVGWVERAVALAGGGGEGDEAREERVREIVRREGGGVGWVERAVALAGGGGGRGH